MSAPHPKVGTDASRLEVLRERLQVIVNEREHRALLAHRDEQLNLLGSIHPGSHLKGAF